MKYDVTLAGETREVEVKADGDGWMVRVGEGLWRRVDGGRNGAVGWRITPDDGATRRFSIALDGEDVFLLDGDIPLRGTVIDPRDHALDLAGGASEGRVATQMPGAVVRVLVEAGAVVAEGEVLCVVEAMKMENEFKAPFAATVASVEVSPGQAVEAGAVLVILEVDAD